MSVQPGDHIRSEIGMLEEMLARIPVGRVIQRVGLEGRIARLREDLVRLPPGGRRFALTFRGDPVEGSRSIDADFAGRALAAFSEAVATIAASLEGELGAAGHRPEERAHSLRIIGPASGSFGFELEIPAAPAPDRAHPLASAVEVAMTVIDGAQAAEVRSDFIAELHPRAASSVRDFVRLVVERRAFFTLRMGTRTAGFVEVSAGWRMLEALGAERAPASS